MWFGSARERGKKRCLPALQHLELVVRVRGNVIRSLQRPKYEETVTQAEAAQYYGDELHPPEVAYNSIRP